LGGAHLIAFGQDLAQAGSMTKPSKSPINATFLVGQMQNKRGIAQEDAGKQVKDFVQLSVCFVV